MKKEGFIRRFLAAALALMMLCGCAGPAGTETTGPVDTTTSETPDHNWELTGNWTVTANDGGLVLTAPSQADAAALNQEYTLAASWEVSARIHPSGDDVARILLCKENGENVFSITVNITDRQARLSLERIYRNTWDAAAEAETPTEFDPAQPLELRAHYYENEIEIQVELSQNGQVLDTLIANDLSTRSLSMLNKVGVGADGSTSFSGVSVEAIQRPETPVDQLLKTIAPGDEGFYTAIAELAMEDVIANFWYGDTDTGHLLHTSSHGVPVADQDKDDGRIWETGLLVYALFDMWHVTGDTEYLDRILAEAAFYREHFTREELVNPLGPSGPAVDDCGWTAMVLICFYEATEDSWFLDTAVELLDNTYARWYNEDLGGMFYKDGVDFMALYGAAAALDWLRIWELTGQQRFYDLALETYEGMHDRLGAGRDDGLYFCEANAFFPRGEAYQIGEAGSASFLSGNMAMAALAAKFYRYTGNQEYLDRVYKTNEGLLQYYDNDGVLINDRDAWTNGTFAAMYASEVLTLPDTEEVRALVEDTALSIVTNARTTDGYYGGSWSGPATGSGSAWYNAGSLPEQSMTTANSVLMVVAAAIYEAGVQNYGR